MATQHTSPVATFSQLLAFSGDSLGLISWAKGLDLEPLSLLLVGLLVVFAQIALWLPGMG